MKLDAVNSMYNTPKVNFTAGKFVKKTQPQKLFNVQVIGNSLKKVLFLNFQNQIYAAEYIAFSMKMELVLPVITESAETVKNMTNQVMSIIGGQETPVIILIN